MLAPRSQLRAFAAALFILGLSVAGTFVLLGGDWSSDRGRVATIIYSCIPGFVGLVIKALWGTRKTSSSAPSAPAVLGLRVHFGWFLVAWAVAVAAALLLTAQEAALTDQGWFLGGRSQAFQRAMAVGPTLMALFAMGQELGFRGFLLGTLQEEGTTSGFRMIAISSLAWACWALPVTIGISEHALDAAWLFVWTVLAGGFLAELRLHSRSVLATATSGAPTPERPLPCRPRRRMGQNLRW